MAGQIRDSNSLNTIRARMTATLRSIDSLVDLQQGTPVKDIVIDAPSVELRGNFVVMDYVQRTRNLDAFLDILEDDEYLADLAAAIGATVDDVIVMVGGDLDDLADTFGITRVSSVKALYLQRFYRTDNNGGAPVTIPLGTEVKTQDGLISCVLITSVAQVPIVDAATGLYYVEETAEASAGGTEGNVALRTLTAMAPRLSQATSTSNVSLIQSGVDIETNESIVDRVKEARKGRNYPTETGIKRLATGALDGSPLAFVDAKVVGPTHPLMVRVIAGGIDCYVVGKRIVSFEEIIRYEAGVDTYVLGMQPIESVSSVGGAVTGAIPFIYNTDVTGGFSGSTRGQGSVTLNQTSGLVDQEALIMRYAYDGAIRTAQDSVSDGGQFHVPAMDLLFRQARQAVIDLDIELVQFGDRTTTDVQTDAENDLAAFFDGGQTSNGTVFAPKAIGEHIDQSDVIAVLAAIDDVDRVTITGPNAIAFRKDTITNTDSPLPIEDNEYARLGTVTFL